jgi:hypothetical protein
MNSFFEKIIGRGIRGAALGIAALVVAFVQLISAKPATLPSVPKPWWRSKNIS